MEGSHSCHSEVQDLVQNFFVLFQLLFPILLLICVYMNKLYILNLRFINFSIVK